MLLLGTELRQVFGKSSKHSNILGHLSTHQITKSMHRVNSSDQRMSDDPSYLTHSTYPSICTEVLGPHVSDQSDLQST